MQLSSVAAIFERLNSANARYIVVGGLAVVAHGHVRFTADVDLVLDMSAKNLDRALRVFGELGYAPRAPVPLRLFADPGAREGWIRDKGLTVFSLWSTDHPSTEVDLFVASPFADFDAVYKRAAWRQIAPDVDASFASLNDLVALKRAAARPQDLLDVERLLELDNDISGDRVREMEGEWEIGWDGHARAQQSRFATLPLTEKIRWLEEAQRLAEQLRAVTPRPSPAADR